MTMRVLVINPGVGETVWPCLRATLDNGIVFLEVKEAGDVRIDSGEVLVLSDTGKCVHRWDLDRMEGKR